MKVMDAPDTFTQSEIETVASGTTPKSGVLRVGNEARVIRVHISGVDSGRSIAVGLPGGFNYLFDADKLMVRMGWTGPFLNVGRDRRSRGGGPCSILGEKFPVGSSEFPLRIEIRMKSHLCDLEDTQESEIHSLCMKWTVSK